MSEGWLRRLAPYLFRNRASLIVTFAAAITGMTAQAVAPLLMQAIVDDVIIARHRALAPLLGALVGIGVARALVGFVRRYYGSKVGVNVDFHLRNDIYEHLHRLDFTQHDAMQTGQLVSRANTDVQILQRLLTFLPIMSSNLLLFPVSLAFMATLSLPLTAIALATVPSFLWLTIRLRRVVYPSAWDASQREAAVAQVVDENVTGVRIVKAFGQERREIDRLASAADELFGARMRNVRLSAKRQATLVTIPLLGQVATLALGGWLAINGDLSVGTFLAFFAYLTQLVAPIGMMAAMLLMAQMARASAERILEVLDSTPTVSDAANAVELTTTTGHLEFRDVSFGYMRSRPVLSGFNLTIAPGETVAIVGASGSGKSTVSMLLPRFYDVQDGAVLVDGIDVRDVSLASLRSHIGVVFEDSFLFSDTVRRNIAYGHPDAADEEVESAARAAEAHQFIVGLSDGYDTVVGEKGLSLSGGQRQRVALARAILTDPRILLLDDATSSIDVRVEEEIHKTLRRLMRGRTTLLIAHRRSSLDLADRIVVVDGGRVVDAGTHDELVARCRLYRRLLAGPDDTIDAESDDPAEDAEPLTAVAAPPTTLSIPSVSMFGAATEELAARIAALPPIVDRPELDTASLIADDEPLVLRRFARPFAGALGIGLGLVAIDALVRLAGPYLIRRGVDRGIVASDEAQLWQAVALFVVAALAGRSLHWFASVHTGRTGQRMLYALRLRVFAQLQRLGLDYYDTEMAGRVMTRMTSDINALNALLQSGLIQGVVQIVTFVGTLVVLATMSPRLTLLVLAVVPPLLGATMWYRTRSNSAYTRVRDGVASVNASFQESVSGIRVAQAFGREQQNLTDYRSVTGDYVDARLDSQRISSVYFPFVEFLSVAATAIVLGAGATMVTDGSLSPGTLIAFALYITTVFAPIQQLSTLFDTYQQAKASLTKLADLLGTPTSIPQATPSVVPGRLRGEIEFADVRFQYAQAGGEVLRGLSVRILAGQRVALVGETGAGKSTVIKLLARLYEPTSGVVRVDATPIAYFDIPSYRRQLGYVPQEAFLFRGTIRDNLAYGKPDATDTEIRRVIDAVGASFIDELTGGLDEPVTERGRSLSAGQRQLIALARALLVDPPILLLDEATANLDLATEAQVTAAMDDASMGRTSIWIAHRLQTAHTCDRVLVIDDGRIVEDGHPHVLAAGTGRYAALWKTYTRTDAAALPVGAD